MCVCVCAVVKSNETLSMFSFLSPSHMTDDFIDLFYSTLLSLNSFSLYRREGFRLFFFFFLFFISIFFLFGIITAIVQSSLTSSPNWWAAAMIAQCRTVHPPVRISLFFPQRHRNQWTDISLCALSSPSLNFLRTHPSMEGGWGNKR